jgi:NADPH:quinone reductase-like Zn-dependent oxidoreductase
MVKVIRVAAFGGPEALRIDDLDIAAPALGEVLVRTGAIGLNRIEAVFRAGGFGAVPLPARIGYEAAGTVERVGAGVTSLKDGDRVVTVPGLDMTQYGTYAEAFLYPANMLVKLPADQALDAAAATWMAFFTAYALAEHRPITRGEAVLVTAASSSVGLAALQVVAAEGGVPIAVTRTRAKAQALKDHGAAHVIVSDEEDVAAKTLELTNGKGAHLAFDAVSGDTIPALTHALSQGGAIIIYGALRGDDFTAPTHMLMLKGLKIQGYSANQVTLDPARLARAIDYIRSGLAVGRFTPVIDKRFAFAEVAEAHRYLESNAQLGKVLLLAP